MAKKKRSTRTEVDVESLTLREVFEDPDGDGDSKIWSLYAAQCTAEDAKIDIKTFITRAVEHLRAEHRDELIANPKEAFRITTEEEDEEDERISRAIGYLDPRPERNFNSPGFRPDLIFGGGEFDEGDEEK